MYSRRIFAVLCAVVLFAICTSDSSAQDFGRMMRIMSGSRGQLHSELLAMEEVQKELKLTEEQVKDIAELASEINSEWRQEAFAILRADGEQSEVDELLKDLQEEEKDLVAKLDDEQKKRLKQLMIQRMGNRLFQRKDIVKKLSITDEQNKEIQKAFDESRKEMGKAMEEAQESGDFQGIRTVMQDFENGLTKSLMGILTDEQKSMLEEMKGKAFEFPQRRRGRRGRSDF